ncbi:MAG: tetratricopeptide repeat protein [Chitinophagaceae bacterium]
MHCSGSFKLYLIAVYLLIASSVSGQTGDFNSMYNNARAFMMQGDYENATLLFNQLSAQQPNNLDVQKDYAYLLYLKRDFSKAMQLAKYITDKPGADVQSFQILGLCYKAIAENAECKKMYKKAISQFPNSGVLYNELGELLMEEKDISAINYWEEGIKHDPNYSLNYYNAAQFYALSGNYFWSLLYGETFVNLESYSQRTATMKGLLLEVYKKWYISLLGSADKWVNSRKNNFEKEVAQQQIPLLNLMKEGVNFNHLLAFRTRFILDYFNSGVANKMPFKLFDFQQQLLREGLFEAYNAWIFLAAESPANYQTWINAHPSESAAFTAFQQSRLYQMPAGQYYQSK